MSANAQQQVDALLRQNNFRLVRQTKHRVWRNPDGKVFVTPSTPSDWRAVKNQVTDLRRILASDPVPEVVAISEYERREALAKLARQEKKTGGAAGAAKTKGTGFTYIDKQREVTSTLTPEQRQAEREQRAWESLVRKTRQEFVASVTAKHKTLAPRFKEDLVRQFREYAESRMEKEFRARPKSEKRASKTYACLKSIWKTERSRVRDMLGPNFYDRAEECSECQKDEENIYFCFGHAYEVARVIALNIEHFMPFVTAEKVVKDAAHIFNAIMRGDETSRAPWGTYIVMRYAVGRANELAEQLLASRPMNKAA